jgi:hypothetical protein
MSPTHPRALLRQAPPAGPIPVPPHSLNSWPTERPSWIRRITSASMGPTERTVMFGSRLWGGMGMVFVQMISRMGKARRRSTAGPERTAWVKQR